MSKHVDLLGHPVSKTPLWLIAAAGLSAPARPLRGVSGAFGSKEDDAAVRTKEAS